MSKTAHPRAGKPTRWALWLDEYVWTRKGWAFPTDGMLLWRTRRDATAYARLMGLVGMRAVKVAAEVDDEKARGET